MGIGDPERPEQAETRREALGRFLRKRREAIAPEDVGIASRRARDARIAPGRSRISLPT